MKEGKFGDSIVESFSSPVPLQRLQWPKERFFLVTISWYRVCPVVSLE